MTLLETLKHIRDNGPVNEDLGLCALADEIGQTNYGAAISDLAVNWPKFSGDRAFPVPSTCKKKSAGLMFWDTKYKPGRWNKRTKYGRLRYELLDFLIAELEKREAEKAFYSQDHYSK